MDFDIVTRLFLGIISAIGTVAVIYLNSIRGTKIKAELLEKFEVAVDKKQKHSVTELFRLIHGIRMSYADVTALITDEDCSKIIYALKTTPGIVCYKEGKFNYSGLGKSSVFRFLDTWYTTFMIIVFSLFAIISFSILLLGKGDYSIIGLVLFIISLVVVILQLREKNYNYMVGNLVTPKEIDSNS